MVNKLLVQLKSIITKKQKWKWELYKRPDGLVVWFSLWVREVPGSIPGQAHLIFFQLNNNY